MQEATGHRCGFTLTDSEGEQHPCDRPTTGWRWYQDVEHEDMLDAACELHSNEGGRLIHDGAEKIVALKADLEEALTLIAVSIPNPERVPEEREVEWYMRASKLGAKHPPEGKESPISLEQVETIEAFLETAANLPKPEEIGYHTRMAAKEAGIDFEAGPDEKGQPSIFNVLKASRGEDPWEG